MTTAKAAKILTKCEADLRAIVAEAADGGDYDAVLRITSWAKQLSLMAGGALITPPEKLVVAHSTQKPVSRSIYPRFARRGEQLVKFGWSKRKKTEYEHKAPLEVALAMSQIATEAGRDGRIFQVKTLLPLSNPTDGSEVPDYQVYMVIAWWRSAGLLDQHGRQGYSIQKASPLYQAVESAWTRLTEE